MENIINKNKIYKDELQLGRLYSDSDNIKNATILKYVKHEGGPMFEHVGGHCPYIKDQHGLIGFSDYMNDSFYEFKGSITLSND